MRVGVPAPEKELVSRARSEPLGNGLADELLELRRSSQHRLMDLDVARHGSFSFEQSVRIVQKRPSIEAHVDVRPLRRNVGVVLGRLLRPDAVACDSLAPPGAFDDVLVNARYGCTERFADAMEFRIHRFHELSEAASRGVAGLHVGVQ